MKYNPKIDIVISGIAGPVTKNIGSKINKSENILTSIFIFLLNRQF